jgi:hypothetical protein
LENWADVLGVAHSHVVSDGVVGYFAANHCKGKVMDQRTILIAVAVLAVLGIIWYGMHTPTMTSPPAPAATTEPMAPPAMTPAETTPPETTPPATTPPAP